MKNKQLFLAMAVLMSMMANNLKAYDLLVNGVYYNYIEGGKELEVTHGDERVEEFRGYSGNDLPTTNLKVHYYAQSDLANLTENVTYMGRTRKVTRIANNAFDKSYRVILTDDGSTFNRGASVENMSNITVPKPEVVIIPSSIKEIGERAFYGCKSIKIITICSEEINNIEKESFYYCSGLTSITIPSSVTSIGSSAFQGCI